MASTVKRREALLNEYKGNLYEFLVAQNLAKSQGVEADFIKNIRDDFYRMLSQQEGFVREFYPELLEDLPELSAGMAEKISKALEGNIVGIRIVGKAAAGSATYENGEADLLILRKAGGQIPVSLKLSKTGAFVNTKSAGVKSFIQKYFSAFPESEKFQRYISAFFDREFERLSYRLHQSLGLEYDASFENWKSAGFSQLPGELPEEQRALFLKFISSVNNEIFLVARQMFEQNPAVFSKCLLPAIGCSREGIVQATSFYRSVKGRYVLDFHQVESFRDSDNLMVQRLENKENTSSFDIYFPDRILQIRLKAMNKFTGKGFKVNCAVKTLKN